MKRGALEEGGGGGVLSVLLALQYPCITLSCITLHSYSVLLAMYRG